VISGLLLAASAATVVTSITLAAAPGGRTALRVASDDASVVSVRREGPFILVSFSGSLGPELEAPAPVAPVEELAIEAAGEAVVIRVRVREEVPHEVRRDGPLLTVLFGELPAHVEPPPPDALELLRSILPSPSEPAAPPATTAAEAPSKADARRQGITLGPVSLRPALEAAYVDGEYTPTEDPQPVPDRYFELRPRVVAELPGGNGRLLAALLDTPTHMVDGALEFPFGANLAVRAAGHHARGTLETNEVDPGYEYFYGLAPFRRTYLTAGARLQLGTRVDLDLGAFHNDVDMDPEAFFFDFTQQGITGSLGFEAAPGLRAALTYAFDRVPTPPERVQAESQAHVAGASLTGEILPLLTGEVAVGFRTQDNPNAGEAGRRYADWVAGVKLKKEFARGAVLQAGGGRAPYPSSFEENGFYVSSYAVADLAFQLPLGLAANAGLSYRVNGYRLPAAGIAEPRRDTIRGWAVGLGRPITRWGFLRVDYRQDRRRSNLPGFETDTHSLLIQAGIGYSGRAEPAR
jgi:hypothetical protein